MSDREFRSLMVVLAVVVFLPTILGVFDAPAVQLFTTLDSLAAPEVQIGSWGSAMLAGLLLAVLKFSWLWGLVIWGAHELTWAII